MTPRHVHAELMNGLLIEAKGHGRRAGWSRGFAFGLALGLAVAALHFI